MAVTADVPAANPLTPAKEEEFFTPNEVAEHNAPEDCWISWLGSVYDLTDLVAQHKGNALITPILQNAGSDISHWFDPETGEPKTHINPHTGLRQPYTPMGRYLHIPPPMPRTDYKYLDGVPNDGPDEPLPWWLDRKRYRKGRLSKKTRKIIVVNTLTKDECTLEVCSEETMTAIQKRYLHYNSHAKGYMWKRLGGVLDMSMTLEENGIKDETDVMERVGMDEDEWLPRIHLFFADDLTVG